MKRIIFIILLYLACIILLKLPILKTKVDDSNFYYKDLLGFVYTRHSARCWLISPCPHWDKPLLGVHSLTFKSLKYNGHVCLDAYGKTRSSVYYLGKKQPQVTDAQSFEFMNNLYAKDSNKIYKLCDLEAIPDTSPEDFQLVGSECSKNNFTVFCFHKEVKEADPKTFNHIELGYYKDKNHIYYFGSKLEGIDPDTFKTLSWGYIKDSNNTYYFDKNTKELTKLINVNSDNFVVLINGYAKDDVQVFFKGERLSDIEPYNFSVPKNDFFNK